MVTTLRTASVRRPLPRCGAGGERCTLSSCPTLAPLTERLQAREGTTPVIRLKKLKKHFHSHDTFTFFCTQTELNPDHFEAN